MKIHENTREIRDLLDVCVFAMSGLVILMSGLVF